jgi:dTDP-4-amino-4,6-dideoxygalactose transaminase
MIRDGGMPKRQAFGEKEREAVLQVLDHYKTEDPPYGGVFEHGLSESFQTSMGGGYATPVATGTGACYLALAALKTYYNIPDGAEVILSPVTDSGPISAIIALGLVPVIADADFLGYNTSLQQIIDCFTDKTAAVFLVHAAGNAVSEVGKIAKTCKNSGIYLVEDCSQAPFAMPSGMSPKYVGSFGDISAFSTMYRKNLHTGGSGGIVYVPCDKNQELFHHVLAHKDRGKPIWKTGINQNDPGNALFPALNWNTDEISCAIGQASLDRIEQTIGDRQYFIQHLQKKLDKYSKVCSIDPQNHSGSSPFYLPIVVDSSKLMVSKTRFAEVLQERGIDLLPHYGCLVSDWEWANEYINWQPTEKFSEGHVPWAMRTPNARRFRDISFNLFLNENYGIEEAIDIALAIAWVEERTIDHEKIPTVEDGA